MNWKKKKSWGGDGDRISDLPDDVLCHILSFIPTIESVGTCVLSKRWNHLWKYAPYLSFDDSRTPASQLVAFANFVNRALSLHSTNLSQFSLLCRQSSELCDVTKWVSESIIKNIQSLDLNIGYCSGAPGLQLPSSLFTCQTLESLVLEGNILLIVPPLVCLPKLRTLKLVGLNYQDEAHLPGTLISSCSSLESLVGFCSALRHLELRSIFCSASVKLPSNVFTWQTLQTLILEGSFLICAAPTISMPNLTFLALLSVKYQDDQILSRLISSCTSLESLNVENSLEAELNICSCSLKVIQLHLTCHSNPGHKLVINVPDLRYLKLYNHGRVDYHIEDLASLEQADVEIHFDLHISPDYSSIINVYQVLWHVKFLKIGQNSKVYGSEHALPMFNRLTELHITMHNRWNCGVLLKFIINSTKLENLTLDGLCGHSWKNPKSVPACLITSLRSVSITNFRGEDGAILMAKYILGNARILEKMEVCFVHSISNYCKAFKKKVCEKISNACRGSEKCVVLIK